MTTIKAFQGAKFYAVTTVIYGAVFLYPFASLLEIQLFIIFLSAALVFVSNFLPLLHKWFDFARIINLLLQVPIIVYFVFHKYNSVTFTLLIYAILIVSILEKLLAYMLSKAGLFHTNVDFLPLSTGILTVRLLAWAGLSSLLATLIYWCIKALFPEAFF